MFIAITLVVPTLCYLGAAGWLMVKDHNYFDAMMFIGYAFANVGVILRLLS